MKRWAKWVMLLLVALIPIAGIYAFNNPKMVLEMFADLGGYETGETLPAVSGVDISEQPLSFGQFSGKRYVAMMAKSDCEVCKSTYPILADWQKNYPDVPFVMVAKGTKEEYQKVKQEQNFQFPILHADAQIEADLKMKIFPVFYVVDENGTVIKRMNGYEEAEFSELIEEARS